MATQEKPRLDPAIARQVIDPSSYAEWDGLLDTFDRLRSETPVAWGEPEDGGVHPPCWLVTRYDDVMRMSKDNATFLNNPHTVVFSLTEGIEFAKRVNRPSVKVMADLNYFLKLDQPLEDIAAEPGFCSHVHIAEGGSQPGTGDRTDLYEHLFRILRDTGYEGAVSCACAWISSDGGELDFGTETEKTLHYLKDLREKIYTE